MKPILFESGETDFTSNGLGRLSDCTSCVVTEERNGAYELEMGYPITGVHYSDIQDSRIIYAPHDDTKKRQPFRIYKISKPISGIVTVNARHLTYDLSTIPVKPFSAGSCVEALQGLKSNALTACPFEFWTDKSVMAKFSTSVPASIRSLLGGQEGSILDTYGTGEYEWDGYTVKFHLHRGADSGVTVRYGKNLTDIEAEASSENAYDGVVPYWASQDEVVTLSTDPIIWKDGSGKTKAVPLDLSSNWQDKPTEGQLRSAAKSYVAARSTNALSQNIKIEFVQLWQTEEYKDIAPLQRVKLCDTVTVQHPGLGISVAAKVIAVKYNVLLDRYDEMELGDAKQTLRDNVTAEIGAATKKLVSQSFMDAAIQKASELIRGGLGGHIVFGTNANGEPEEILVMDTADKNTAVNVIRINKNGIGFSSTGYNGPFKSAWTIDGHFVADFITTGTIRAALIKAGVLSDARGLNSWNMETGELHINTLSNLNASNLIQGTLDGWMWGGGVSSGQWESSNPACPETNGRGFALPTNSDGSWRYASSKGFVLKNGMNYTLSYYNTAYNCNATIIVRTNESNSSQWTVPINESSSNSGAWVKHVINFKCTKTGTYYCIIGNEQISGLSSGNMALQGLKLEQGNLATGWTPHPEDLEAHVAITRSKDGSAALVAEAPNLYFNASDRITVNAGSKILYKDVDAIKFMTPRASNPSENYERGLTQFVKDVMGNVNDSTYIAGQNLRLYSQGGISSFYVDNIYVATNYDSPRKYVKLKDYIKGVMNGTY